MVGGSMSSSFENLSARAKSIAKARTDDFGKLLRLGGLNPQKHLRCANFSGVDFSGCDLRGFDFTGARLHGCVFDGALIAGARFDQAEIDRARFDPARRTRLRAAKDWADHVAEWRKPEALLSDAHLPAGAVFQDAPFAPDMVVIPPGQFTMGSPPGEVQRYEDESPRRMVTIPQAFAAGRCAVTFEEWDFAQMDKSWGRITGVTARKPKDEGWGRGNRPVINVSWEDAQAYVRWLRAKTARDYRLLSEAEWEYAARAGTTTPFWWGSSIAPDQANYNGNYVYDGGGEKGDYRQKTVPVDQFRPNPFGLYQIHGNIWEWVEDCWNRTYAGAPTDGSAWTAGDIRIRVLRGGSLNFAPRFLRSACRFRNRPDFQYYDVGFRLARTLL